MKSTYEFQTRGLLKTRRVTVEAESEQEAAEMAARVFWPKCSRESGLESISAHLWGCGAHLMTLAGPVESGIYRKRRTV